MGLLAAKMAYINHTKLENAQTDISLERTLAQEERERKESELKRDQTAIDIFAFETPIIIGLGIWSYRIGQKKKLEEEITGRQDW